MSISILLIITLSISIFVFYNDKFSKKEEVNPISENNSNNSNNLVSIMLEKEAGTGKYEKSNEGFPTEGYVFNKDLSKCVNGSEIDYENNAVVVKAVGTDKCYAYFDVDALGSICRGENMAECFIKNYQKDKTIIYHDGLADYPEEENYKLEAEDLSYRYTGGNDIVHNYVCLDNNSDENCPDEDLYRIIGLFKNNEGNYEIKLIKYNALGRYPWDNHSDSSEISWKNSSLNTLLNGQDADSYYNKMISNIKSLIVMHNWMIAGNDFSYLVYNTNVKTSYINEMINYNHSVSEENITYDAYIGLININDYGYAASSDVWANVPLFSDTVDDYRSVKSKNWLYFGNDMVTITNWKKNGAVFVVNIAGYVGTHSISVDVGVFPCFYITNSAILQSGSGTKENPYRFAI